MHTGMLAVIQNQDKYALLLNKRTGNITFPAGAKEGDETELETLQREVQEETGLKPNQYNVINRPVYYEYEYNKKKTERAGQKAKQASYLLETDELNLKPELNDVEILGWYAKEQVLNKLTFEDMKQVFLKLIKETS